jgi:hypothetical protein
MHFSDPTFDDVVDVGDHVTCPVGTNYLACWLACNPAELGKKVYDTTDVTYIYIGDLSFEVESNFSDLENTT